MLSSAAYINSGLVRGDTTPAPVSASVPVEGRTQGKYARPEQGGSLLLAAADTVELSPAARRLAQQNSEGVSAPLTTKEAQAEQQGQLDGVDDTAPSEAEDAEEEATASATISAKLSALEHQEVQELKLRDQEVRTHEAAHAAVGGQYAGAPTLEYETGPDGKRYAVAGEVNIDLSKIAGDPQETIAKMEQIQAAALAPAQPSAQDRRVAARAAQIAAQARMDLRTEQNSTRSAEPSNAESPTMQNSTTSAPNSAINSGDSRQPVPPSSISTPAITIESLLWAGAVA